MSAHAQISQICCRSLPYQKQQCHIFISAQFCNVVVLFIKLNRALGHNAFLGHCSTKGRNSFCVRGNNILLGQGGLDQEKLNFFDGLGSTLSGVPLAAYSHINLSTPPLFAHRSKRKKLCVSFRLLWLGLGCWIPRDASWRGLTYLLLISRSIGYLSLLLVAKWIGIRTQERWIYWKGEESTIYDVWCLIYHQFSFFFHIGSSYV